MAPQRAHLGGLIAGVAVLAAILVGCGGGSSSAPDTASSPSDSTSPSSAATAEAGGGPGATNPARPKANDKGNGSGNGAQPPADSKPKHPPIELPTGAPERGPTEAQKAKVPTAAIALSLPRQLAAVNTCQGKNASPELVWGTVPPDTVELAVFAVNLQPVDGKLHFDWAMAGLDPSLEGLKEGEVPKGAILGRNSDGQNGYSLCPRDSKAEVYLFSVFAISKDLSPARGFEPLRFRVEATRASEENGIATVTYAPE